MPAESPSPTAPPAPLPWTLDTYLPGHHRGDGMTCDGCGELWPCRAERSRPVAKCARCGMPLAVHSDRRLLECLLALASEAVRRASRQEP